jgi:hypothetical protein
MRRAAAVLGALIVLAGCVEANSDADRIPSIPKTSLLGPGTPLVSGIVAPPGTRLVASVFPRPVNSITTTTTTAAVLEVDGDPFAAWDHLADQAKAAGAALPHSGICLWHRVRTAPTGIQPEPVSVSEPRPPEADTLACDASAGGTSRDGRLIRVGVRLWWWAAGAELGIDFYDDATPVADASFPDVDPGPAPASAVDQLPPRDDPVQPSVGDPFGRETNCGERGGYRRLRLPEGSRLVGGGTSPVLGDFAAVLAVADVEEVLEALRSQLDSPDTGSVYEVKRERTTDGASIWTLSGGSDGGGFCSFVSNPDGHLLLVTTTSD